MCLMKMVALSVFLRSRLAMQSVRMQIADIISQMETVFFVWQDVGGCLYTK